MNQDFGLEFLLDFDGRIHHLEGGYWLKFEIKRVSPSPQRPHGLRYSLTLHDPSGQRLVGFDNAHALRVKGSRLRKRRKEHDHWHRTDTGAGRPYRFIDAATLIDDFFDEVERVLAVCGTSTNVVREELRGKR